MSAGGRMRSFNESGFKSTHEFKNRVHHLRTVCSGPICTGPIFAGPNCPRPIFAGPICLGQIYPGPICQGLIYPGIYPSVDPKTLSCCFCSIVNLQEQVFQFKQQPNISSGACATRNNNPQSWNPAILLANTEKISKINHFQSEQNLVFFVCS